MARGRPSSSPSSNPRGRPSNRNSNTSNESDTDNNPTNNKSNNSNSRRKSNSSSEASSSRVALIKKTKYPSRFVGKLIEVISSDKLKTVSKNPKAVSKWLEKLKISIQKKVSIASKVAFRNSSNDALLAGIKRVQAEISAKCELIGNKLGAIVQQSAGSWIPPLHSSSNHTSNDSNHASTLDNRVAELSAQLKLVAEQLSSTTEELSSKTASLNSTVTVIENWKNSHLVHTLNTTSSAPAAAGAMNSADGSYMSSIAKELQSNVVLTGQASHLQTVIDHLGTSSNA